MDSRALILLGLVLGACGRDEPRGPALPDRDAAVLAVPDEYIRVGAAAPSPAMPNPFAGDADAIGRGRELFARYNCDGCHGDEGVGNFCPALNDGRWNYGGAPVQIAQSIREGRPLGMPSFGDLIAGDDLWRLVAYLQSLAPSADISTQNARDWGGGPRQGTRAAEENAGGQ